MPSPDEKFTLRFVKARLREIEEQAKQLQATAEAALKEIANLDRIRILRWRCVICGHVIAFTKPSAIEACGPCQHCKGTRWVPDGSAAQSRSG